MALTALLGHLFSVSTFTLNVLTLMGLAVGIDYSLFIVSRFREELARGLAEIDAIAAAGRHRRPRHLLQRHDGLPGHARHGLVPLDITISMALGVMLVVFMTLLTTLILLPALLGCSGDRVNALRVPIVGRRLMNARPRAAVGDASGSRTASCAARSGSRWPSGRSARSWPRRPCSA